MENEKEWQLIDELHKVLNHIKTTFIGKEDIVDLMGICLLAKENLFILGPPGTAKSALVRELSKLIKGKNFEYLLTRFTEPSELFGPFDIRELKEGNLKTNTTGMLPEANLIFLDEIFNANSAILNSLLMVLNERVFRRGSENKKLPVLMAIGASNQLPQEESLEALYDRFLIRVHSDYVSTELLSQVLDAGWNLEKKEDENLPEISPESIVFLQNSMLGVDLSGIKKAYIELIQKMRNAGIAISDRRAVKLQGLIAASALMCKRTTAILSDLWVLRNTWDTAEQQEVLASLVNEVIKEDSDISQHPRATMNRLPNADELFKDVEKMALSWENASLSEKSTLKDKLRQLDSQAEWLVNKEQKDFVKKAIDELWTKILHTN